MSLRNCRQPTIERFFFSSQPQAVNTVFKETANKKRKIRRQFLSRRADRSCYDNTKFWKNYFFTATNNFELYSVVIAVPYRDTVRQCVWDSGFEVATAEVDDDSALTNIWVHPDFRRQGIGSELVRFINRCCQQFYVFAGNDHNSRYRLTTEGAALIQDCVNRGILTDEQVIAGYCPVSPDKTAR